MLKILIFAKPYPNLTGGCRRSYEVLRRLGDHNVEPIVVVDRSFPVGSLDLGPAARYVEINHAVSFENKIFSTLKPIAMLARYPERVARALEAAGEVPDLVVSHHEDVTLVPVAQAVASRLGLPWTAVLQSPYRSFRVWPSQRIFLRHPLQYAFQVRSLKALSEVPVLSLSPSIPLELGCRLDFIYLDPPIGVDHELIKAIEKSDRLFDAVYYARLTPLKGVFDVLHIWRRVLKENPDARLAVIGEFAGESTRSWFHELVRSLGLERKVSWLGFLEHRDLFSQLKSSKLLVYPSRIDAFPLVVLESLCCGLPVVAYDTPAIRLNYAVDSVVRVPVRDIDRAAGAVVGLLRDEQERRRLSRLAVDFGGRFTWDMAAKSEAEAYSKIVEERK